MACKRKRNLRVVRHNPCRSSRPPPRPSLLPSPSPSTGRHFPSLPSNGRRNFTLWPRGPCVGTLGFTRCTVFPFHQCS